MNDLWPEIIGLIAAGFSALATGLAAWAAWRVPKSAALLSERLRRDGESIAEERRMKLYVFTTLMQERASAYSLESVRALNLIDVVFRDSMPVREAWAELYNSFGDAGASESDRQARLRALLKSMAIDVGVSDQLRVDDFGRIYFPNALAEEEEIRLLERKSALARLKDAPTSQRALTFDPFPPKPGK